jgi:hypothetical protein
MVEGGWNEVKRVGRTDRKRVLDVV